MSRGVFCSLLFLDEGLDIFNEYQLGRGGLCLSPLNSHHFVWFLWQCVDVGMESKNWLLSN